jgi:hypothetical protein
LSQFSRKLKKKSADGDSAANGDDFADDNTDPFELEIEQQLDMLENEINGTGVGDDEPVMDDNDDEIAGDVASSDALAVDAAILEASQSIRVDALSSAEANIGCVSIAKVSPLSI